MIGPKKISALTALERRRLLRRSEVTVSWQVFDQVRRIVGEVRRRGDEALLEYTVKYDRVQLTAQSLRVNPAELEDALTQVPERVMKALKEAADDVSRFHSRLLPPDVWMEEISPGVRLGRIRRAIDTVGIYIPGGRAIYPSTALMTAVPAKVAGVRRVVACSPPSGDGKINPIVLAALRISGVDEVYKVGGAQAIAAMAHGTETVPKVDKIVGPGNVYVAAAKSVVRDVVEIDVQAGPSEVLILADGGANPQYVALDLVSQAEHDPDSYAVLVATSMEVGVEVWERLRLLQKELKRSSIVRRSLQYNGAILVAGSLDEAVSFVNDFAPEHLELMVEDPEACLHEIESAGSVFIGSFSPVSAGDYATGANHVLPTGGKAKYRSGLSVEDFLKMITIQRLTQEGLSSLRQTVKSIAEVEGFEGHVRAVEERFCQR
jgi:histidinol dehydrogenase